MDPAARSPVNRPLGGAAFPIRGKKEPEMAEAGVATGDRDQSGAEERKRGGGFPAPITILLLVLVLVWLATFFIPSGQYQVDGTGSPIAGSFQRIEPPLDFGGRVRDLLLAPVNGMYGILDPATGRSGRSTAASCSARSRCSCSSWRSAAS
jgi:hypothetical protein